MLRPASANPVTRAFSTTVAPPIRAPLASDWVRSVGLTLPSPGSHSAPSRSSTCITGHSSCARGGETSSQSMSYAAALAAVRFSWTIRSSVRATITPPTLR